ncbi:MAG: hypothetical protein QF685_01060 [Verrucomicrobiota bacterium]|jgi:hypothetical protein|nr:hypothetical protein [Verrucomicrobiota bacterium]
MKLVLTILAMGLCLPVMLGQETNGSVTEWPEPITEEYILPEPQGAPTWLIVLIGVGTMTTSLIGLVLSIYALVVAIRTRKIAKSNAIKSEVDNKAQPDESGAGKLPPPLTTATCMWCLEEVKAGAKVCKHCGKNPSE